MLAELKRTMRTTEKELLKLEILLLALEKTLHKIPPSLWKIAKEEAYVQ